MLSTNIITKLIGLKDVIVMELASSVRWQDILLLKLFKIPL